MDITLLVIHLAMIVVLVILGLVFRSGRGAFLIAGYNTMSAEEKAQYDKKKLCKVVGNFMFVLAALWIPILVGSMLDNMIVHVSGVIVFCAVALIGALFVDKAAKKE